MPDNIKEKSNNTKSEKEIKYDCNYGGNVDFCSCCGAVIPEGAMVCFNCNPEAYKRTHLNEISL